MAEKKQVLYDLRAAYSGPFLVEDFYSEVDKWIREKGFEKEQKKKMEHVTKDGKKIEWLIEAHYHLDSMHHGIIVLRALFDNIKEVAVKKSGRKIRVNNGDALISIDAFIQSHIHGSFWQVKPVLYFIRAVIDKYIYNFWTDKYDGKVSNDAHGLFKRIRAFFNLQKYKYE